MFRDLIEVLFTILTLAACSFVLTVLMFYAIGCIAFKDCYNITDFDEVKDHAENISFAVVWACVAIFISFQILKRNI